MQTIRTIKGGLFVIPPRLIELVRQSHKTRLLGLDVSIKAVGIAISDVDLQIASPLTILLRNPLNHGAIYTKINQLIQQQQNSIGGIVIGWPLNVQYQMDSSCHQVNEFTQTLLEKTTLPITYWDERGSSGHAKALLDKKMMRKHQRYDDLAASFILQSYLDEHYCLKR